VPLTSGDRRGDAGDLGGRLGDDGVVRRLRELLHRPVSGAVAGQATHALSGLALQVAAARELGAAGFAAFSLGYGALVLVTAVCSGLVGDSLTVLDRTHPRLRAGLHGWTGLVCLAAGLAGALAGLVTGMVPPAAGPLLAGTCVAFIVQDTLRRLLMATGRFWSLTAVDLTGLVLVLGTLLVASAGGRLTMASFVVSLLVAQSGAALVAWFRLPVAERPRGPWRRPDLRGVATFGMWRAAAQTIRPASWTLLRVLVISSVGAAAYAPLETARLYTAPTLLLVTGVGSYLLTHFVALRHRPVAECLRIADRSVFALVAGAGLVGALGLATLPWFGDAITGGDYPVPAVAVVGWTCYAMTAAAFLPYAGLASVHGGQRRVLLLRLWEFGSLAIVLVLVRAVPGGEVWAPLALALGPALAVAAVRQSVLVPLVRAESPPRPGVERAFAPAVGGR